MLTSKELKQGLLDIGVREGMILEVHSSLKSFGYVMGGAGTVIQTIKEVVTDSGSIFMPALRLSKEQELTDWDKEMGITVKIKVLESDCEHSAMGAIADTFRKMPDTYTGEGVFRISGWGKHGKEAVSGGLDYALEHGGKALLLGVDIYKLTAMHYVENLLPNEIKSISAPNEIVNRMYPSDQWVVEMEQLPVKAWYTIQQMAYEKGLIKDGYIGKCKVMFFDLWDIVSIYERELKNDPFKLYGIQ